MNDDLPRADWILIGITFALWVAVTLIYARELM